MGYLFMTTNPPTETVSDCCGATIEIVNGYVDVSWYKCSQCGKYLNPPTEPRAIVSEFTDHTWREKPCGCKQYYFEGNWENRIRCEKHQKIVDRVESKLPPMLKENL